MLEKSKTLAFGSRILLVIISAFIVLVIYFIVHGYYDSIRSSRSEILKKLQAIAYTTSRLINPSDHEYLVNRYTRKDAIQSSDQDSIYHKIHLMLKDVQQNTKLETPLYTFVFNPKDSLFYFVVTSAQHPYYFHDYRLFPQALLKNYHVGGTLDVYTDENGSWLSAFHPIKNHAGKTIALIQADKNFSYFLTEARINLMWNALVSFAILLPFGLLLFSYISKLLKRQEEFQNTLKEQNEEIKTQTEIIERANQELDKRVKKRTQELEALNKELSQFLYHYSHDIQAPIATLKGLFGLAMKELTESKSLDYIQRMDLTTDRLESITKTIKLVHEIKMSDIKPAPIPLKELLVWVIDSLSFQNRLISYEIDIPDNYKIINDRRLISTMFFELIKNSFQYSRSDHEKTLISIKLVENQPDYSTFEIDDNGEGIDPFIKQEIFLMFKRGSDKSEGSGLGLTLVKSCLEKTQGTIKLKTKSSPGTTFVLRLKKFHIDY